MSPATAQLNSIGDCNEIRACHSEPSTALIRFCLSIFSLPLVEVSKWFRCLPIRPPVRSFLVPMTVMCATWPEKWTAVHRTTIATHRSPTIRWPSAKKFSGSRAFTRPSTPFMISSSSYPIQSSPNKSGTTSCASKVSQFYFIILCFNGIVVYATCRKFDIVIISFKVISNWMVLSALMTVPHLIWEIYTAYCVA